MGNMCFLCEHGQRATFEIRFVLEKKQVNGCAMRFIEQWKCNATLDTFDLVSIHSMITDGVINDLVFNFPFALVMIF